MKYYAYKKYGSIPLAGPFRTRAEAKGHGAKTGGSCCYCGRYSGGMEICYACLCVIFDNSSRKRK
uniref:Uncharacterized protein n=1 Tax=viral metagenome TaxID=1070528 RepID=A0A6M3X9C8_9ZZZZ